METVSRISQMMRLNAKLTIHLYSLHPVVCGGLQVHIHHSCAWVMSQSRTRAAYPPKSHRLLLVNLNDFSFSIFFSTNTAEVSLSAQRTNRVWQLWQAQNEKHSRPWHIELGATRQQVVLSLRSGPWAPEWNGQRGFLLWDEWRRRCYFWSGRVAEYWGDAAEAEASGSTCPPNFTVEMRQPPYMLVATAMLQIHHYLSGT